MFLDLCLHFNDFKLLVKWPFSLVPTMTDATAPPQHKTTALGVWKHVLCVCRATSSRNRARRHRSGGDTFMVASYNCPRKPQSTKKVRLLAWAFVPATTDSSSQSGCGCCCGLVLMTHPALRCKGSEGFESLRQRPHALSSRSTTSVFYFAMLAIGAFFWNNKNQYIC